MGTQNCTSKFHNLTYTIPILKWDAFMNMWIISLTYYIKSFLLREGQNFNPFTCLIFL